MVAACVAFVLPACTSDGHFSILGYTTKPNYASDIRTVHVPVFGNRTFYRGLEIELTKEVVRQIEDRTPFKVVSCAEDADTELKGVIANATKQIINRNQLNEVREAETLVAVELVWQDLRTGKILSKPCKPGEEEVDTHIPGMPDTSTPISPDGTPALPPPVPGPEPGPPGPKPVVVVQSLAHFIPELGESITTAHQKNVKRLATQIVSMMELPW
jgi:hypothetical protein